MSSHTHSHAHSHHHHAPQHAPTVAGQPAAERALPLAVGLTLGFAAIEALTGWWAGSLALLGDAGHMLGDGAALGLAALAAWLARRPPSARHSYGLGRADVLAAVLNGLAMLAITAAMLAAAIHRLQQPQPVEGGAVLIVACLGLLLNLWVAALLGQGNPSLNLRGALLHVLGDLLGSAAAILSGAVILLTGWTPIDPILSLLIAGLILFSSLRLLRDAAHVLMEGVPPHLSLAEIGQAMCQAGGVRSVHDLHVWTLASGQIGLSAHVVVDRLEQWESVWLNLAELLHERYRIEHVTLQPEPWQRALRRIEIPNAASSI
jgi:cobalt-zinc-cadmium efflux system protein